MSKITVLYNQDYTNRAENFPGKKRMLENLGTAIQKGSETSPDFVGVAFTPGHTNNIHEHVQRQILRVLPSLMDGETITCFGDSGNGVVLGAIDRIAREHEMETGHKLPELTDKGIYLAPGGTYNHGPRVMGTLTPNEVTHFAGKDHGRYDVQLVKMRNAQVQKTTFDGDHQTTTQKDHPFFAFAGMFFDAYILEVNEQLSRQGGVLSDTAKVTLQALKDIFGSDILAESSESAKPKSMLRAYTTVSEWGMAKFDPNTVSLDQDHFYEMKSDTANALGMLKIAAVINIIGSNRSLLNCLFKKINDDVANGKTPKPMSISGILHQFKPEKITSRTLPFDPSYLGGLSYSTDGFPHRIELKPNEQATLTLSTIRGSGLNIIKKR